MPVSDQTQSGAVGVQLLYCTCVVTGSTLKEYITRSPFSGLDTYTALMLMQNLLRILVYLQSKNVIHNDIKGTQRLLLWVMVIVMMMVMTTSDAAAAQSRVTQLVIVGCHLGNLQC